MESRFLFQDDMDIDPGDFNSVEDFIQKSFDDLVGDAVTINNRYAGLTVSKTGITTIGITTGRIYQGGQVYASNNPLVNDFLTSLPVASLKNVLVIGSGVTQQAQAIPREFLLDETTGASEPRVVAVEQDRVANLTYAYGVESPTPVDPVIQPAYTIIARVVLSTAGIQSVTMIADNALDNVDDLAVRMRAVEAFEAAIEPQISTLASDIARLSNQVNQPAPSTELIAQLLLRVATLESKVGVPSTAQSSAADYFLDTSLSDTANPLYLAQIEEGIRYAYDAENVIPFALFNPADPSATVSGGVIFPTYTRSLRQSVGPIVADVQISAYAYQTVNYVQKTMTLTRIRYGTPFEVCTNSAFWQSGSYNSVTGVFTAPDGETFNAIYDYNIGANLGISGDHNIIRLTEFWTDTYTEPYWDAIVTNGTVTGAQVAETFLCGQDFWLESIGLYFTAIDSTTQAPVTVILCECNDQGEPDLTQVITQATVGAANLQIWPSRTVFAWTPAYLQAGNRYAIVVVTTGNHRVATAAGSAFTQGTFFTLAQSGYALGDLTRHLCFDLNSCKFNNPTTTLQLQPLQLSGGMCALDFQFGNIAPASTSLTFSILLGGKWVPLSADTAGQLNAGGNLPALLQLQVTMLGTPDIMPAINTVGATITVSRPKTSLVHISTPRTPPAATQNITVIEEYDNYNSQYHTQNVTLLTGATFGTEVQPSSFSDVPSTNSYGGTGIIRTYKFNLSAVVSAYKIKTAMTTQTALITQFAASRQDFCL